MYWWRCWGLIVEKLVQFSNLCSQSASWYPRVWNENHKLSGESNKTAGLEEEKGRGLSFNGIAFHFEKVTILLVPSWWGMTDKHWSAGYFCSISEFALPYMCTHSFGNTPANLNPKGLFGWLICCLSTLSKSNLEWTLHWKAFVKLLGNLCFQNNSIRVLIQYLMLFCLFFYREMAAPRLST